MFARMRRLVLNFDDYLDRLASSDPTPGGGSAAALTGAMAAALLAMVARITLGSEKHTHVHPLARRIVHDADALRADFVAARPIDEAAYGAVIAVQALPRGSEHEKRERMERMQIALTGAAEAPLGVAGLATDAIRLAELTAALGNDHLMSDVDCALRLARAALDASAANVKVNHRFLKNAEVITAQASRLAAFLDTATAAERRTLRRISA
jgi:formiminotetrahydrofolate cyclodeaminase